MNLQILYSDFALQICIDLVAEKAVQFITGHAIKRFFLMKLKDRYSDHLCFAEINGRKNVLCFKNMANCIINGKQYEKGKC